MFFGQEYTCSAQASAAKAVTCEQCGTPYAYAMTRTASGRDCAPYGLGCDKAKRRAYEKAVQAAQKALAGSCEPVPCPDCGWYQTDMVKQLRRQRHRWMTFCGGWLLFLFLGPLLVGIILYLAPGQEQLTRFVVPLLAATGVMTGIGLTLWTGQKVLSSGYDPNACDVEERKRIGRSRVLNVDA
jgi:hypothetical protein